MRYSHRIECERLQHALRAAVARAEAAEAKMETITAIAHFGGLADLSAIDALSLIRFATSEDTFSKLASKSPREVKEFILRKIKETK